MGLNFIKNEPLFKYTNFRIGGAAKYFFEAKSSNEIIEAVKWADEHSEPFFILGGGSNTLVSDEGFNGLVIKIASRQFKILDHNALHSRTEKYSSVRGRQKIEEDRLVYVEAGALSAFVARKTAEAGLTGFEWAVSLPGTIGGAVRGNAGCFGGEMKDVVSRVNFFTPLNLFSDSRESENGSRSTWNVQNSSKDEWKKMMIDKEKCEFSYRDSFFKHLNPVPIILSAELELQKDDPQKCLERIQQNLAKRKEKQPLGASSAGCIFKNFKFQISNFKFNFHAPSEFIKSGSIPAGWLIEQAELLGLRVGDAEVSTKHGNFVLNRGKARAQDVIDLVQKIKDTIYQKFGIELQEEIQYVGF